jgi:hypothetical protein
VFARGTAPRHRLVYRSADEHSWHSWAELGSLEISSTPAGTCWGPNRVDVFARGADHQLLHMWHDSTDWSHSTWSDWEVLALPSGISMASAPAACSRARGELLIFFLGSDGNLHAKTYVEPPHGPGWADGPGWGLETGSTRTPAAVAWHQTHRLDVFAPGATSNVLHRSFELNHGFSEWEDLGGTLNSGVAAASMSPGRLAIFGRTTGNLMVEKYYSTQHGWTDWRESAPAVQIRSTPAAIASETEPHTYAVFARGGANDVIIRAYQDPPHASHGGSHWYNDAGRVVGDILTGGLWEGLRKVPVGPVSGGSGEDGGDGGDGEDD